MFSNQSNSILFLFVCWVAGVGGKEIFFFSLSLSLVFFLFFQQFRNTFKKKKKK